MGTTGRKVIAVIVGLILLGGIVFCVSVRDETTILMTAMLGVIYVIYLVRLSKELKKADSGKKKPETPLARRR